VTAVRSARGLGGGNHRRARGVETSLFAASVVISAAIAASVRLWSLGYTSVNSDEAIVGLMARSILHGHGVAFYWGQDYGGVEPYVVAAMFRLFGQSPMVLNLTPVLLALTAALVVWRIGLRVLAPRAAIAAACLTWIWPEAALWNSTREFGFRQATLVLGLVVLLATLRILQGSPVSRWRGTLDWLLLGGSVGLGWWSSPEIVYFVVPAAYLLAFERRDHTWPASPTQMAVAVAATALGSLPWWVATFHDRFATIRSQPDLGMAGNTYLLRLATFFTHVLPMLLGMRIEGYGVWEGGPAVGVTLYVLALALIVVAMVHLAGWLRRARFLVVFVLAFPFLYAVFPSAWFWNDGRYGLYLTPVLALVVMGASDHALRASLSRLFAIMVIVLATSSTLIAFSHGFADSKSVSTWTANPNPAVQHLADELPLLGIHDIYASYWVAYDLEFLSAGHIIAVSPADDRILADAAVVRSARSVGWVFIPPDAVRAVSKQLGSFTDLDPDGISRSTLMNWLTTKDIPFESRQIGLFDLVIPGHNVAPSQVAGSA